MQRLDDSYFSAMHLIIQPDANNRGGIYLGNIDAAENQETLKSLNINAVVTVASGAYLNYPNNFEHLVIPALDIDSFDLFSRFEECINFINKNRQKTNVLIHCFAGVSRSATITIAYMMKTFNQTYLQAFEEVKKKRSCISPNEGFIEQLKDFEKNIFTKSK